MGVNIITAATRLFKEGGTGVIRVSFEDENGDAMTPDTLYWSLRDEDEDIVNERDEVQITSLGTSVDIVLQGDDLPAKEVKGQDYYHLWVVLKGTYTSTYGSALPFADQVRISVEPLKGVTQ